jgi:hypothetical protein
MTRPKRKPSAATLRAVAVERRAAELAGHMLGGCGIPDPFGDDEDRGWNQSAEAEGFFNQPFAEGPTPRTPAELAGWLAREIWSES